MMTDPEDEPAIRRDRILASVWLRIAVAVTLILAGLTRAHDLFVPGRPASALGAVGMR